MMVTFACDPHTSSSSSALLQRSKNWAVSQPFIQEGFILFFKIRWWLWNTCKGTRGNWLHSFDLAGPRSSTGLTTIAATCLMPRT